MPSVKNHIGQAQRNKEFYESIKDKYPDWGVTALFYCALHYVDAFLKSKNLTVEDHTSRFRWIERIQELKPLYADYSALYKYSINVRYKMIIPGVEDLQNIQNAFIEFEKFAAKYLTRPESAE